VICTNSDLRSFKQVSPMIECILGGKEFTFLGQIVLLSGCQLLGFIGDLVKSLFSVTIFSMCRADSGWAVFKYLCLSKHHM